jgi:YD repeat-containing protein
MGTCESSCVSNARTAGIGYGDLRQHGHNLREVRDGLGQTFLTVEYGTDRTLPSFDAVVKQTYGEATIRYYWRDLRGEAEGVTPVPSESWSLAIGNWTSAPPRCPGAVLRTAARAVAVDDAFGFLWTEHHDGMGRLLRRKNHGTSATWFFEYDANGNPVGEIGPSGEAVCSTWAGPGRLIEQTFHARTGSTEPPIRRIFEYADARFAKLLRAYDPVVGILDPTSWTDLTWNLEQVTAAIQHPTGETTTWAPSSYGVPDNRVAVDGSFTKYDLDIFAGAPYSIREHAASSTRVTSTWYDTAGRPVFARGPYGAETTWTWYAGRLDQRTETSGTRLDHFFEYDDDGQVTLITEIDPATGLGREIEHDYDLIGQPRRTTERSLDGSLGERVTCYRYGNDHRLLESVRADGVRQRVTYDGEGRVLTVEQGGVGRSTGKLGRWLPFARASDGGQGHRTAQLRLERLPPSSRAEWCSDRMGAGRLRTAGDNEASNGCRCQAWLRRAKPPPVGGDLETGLGSDHEADRTDCRPAFDGGIRVRPRWTADENGTLEAPFRGEGDFHFHRRACASPPDNHLTRGARNRRGVGRAPAPDENASAFW